MVDIPGLPAELLDWHRRHAEAQRAWRNVSLTCRRCGDPFEIRQRVLRKSKSPSICPACIADRHRQYLHVWRARRRAERKRAHADRRCSACGKSMPEGRADRAYCSNGCRQRAYRKRLGAAPG